MTTYLMYQKYNPAINYVKLPFNKKQLDASIDPDLTDLHFSLAAIGDWVYSKGNLIDQKVSRLDVEKVCNN